MRRAALIAAVVALLAGCGGETETTAEPETVEGTATTQPQPQPQSGGTAGDAAAGKEVFASNGCGSCHTFQPAGSSGTTGPDLDKLADFAEKAGKPVDEFTRESIEDPEAYVEEGFPGGVMPSYDQLDETQLNNLVAFLTQG